MVKVRSLSFHVYARISSSSYDVNHRLVEGEWTDDEIADPLSDMFALLTARRDRALTQRWGVWLAAKDAERAVKVGHAMPLGKPPNKSIISLRSY